MSMRRSLACLLVAELLLGLGACATSDEQAGNEVLADASPKDEIICRRQRQVGSHIPVHVCRTRAQVEADQRAALEAVGPLRTMSGDLPRPPRPPSNSN